ncbi:MAG: kinase/pyrophosphorylase, partial [Gammaproteobacteria bacterium]
PFVDNITKAHTVAAHILHQSRQSVANTIVFSTLVEPELQDIVAATGACVIDLFSAFIEPLEVALAMPSAHTQGLSHSEFGKQSYQDRLNAIEYTLSHDDGVRPDQYPDADIILVGISRCGKTPTSLYLAMNFFLKAANYPLTDHELEQDTLPPVLQTEADKLVALSIDARTLCTIRQQRRPGSDYASLEVCQREVRSAGLIFRNAGLPLFDTTATSIEEIAGWIVKEKGLLNTAPE